MQLLACIGEVFTEGDDVCGVSMNLRAKNRCSVWTRTAANESKQVSCLPLDWCRLLSTGCLRGSAGA